jgi:Flp pilus assembly secretin CpaC
MPILGWFFRSREVAADGEELIVIITPSVITDTIASPKR